MPALVVARRLLHDRRIRRDPPRTSHTATYAPAAVHRAPPLAAADELDRGDAFVYSIDTCRCASDALSSHACHSCEAECGASADAGGKRRREFARDELGGSRNGGYERKLECGRERTKGRHRRAAEEEAAGGTYTRCGPRVLSPPAFSLLASLCLPDCSRLYSRRHACWLVAFPHLSLSLYRIAHFSISPRRRPMTHDSHPRHVQQYVLYDPQMPRCPV